MTQLTLSTDLQVITAEINSYKQIAGQSVFEIGKRLKHVKENDLAHGDWERWCREEIEMTPQHANRFVKVFEELGANRTSGFDLVGVKALYEIATLPSEEREREHILKSGAIKTPDDMTVKELREVKKALKEAEERARQAEMDRQAAVAQKFTLAKQIEDLEKKKGRSPEDEARLQELSQSNVDLTQTIHKLQDELHERNTAMEKRSHDLRKMKESLSKTSAYIVVDLSTALMHFRSIHDQREAIEVAERFWIELDETIAKKRSEWQELMENNISESEESHNERRTIGTVRGRQAVVIDADTLPGGDG